MTLNESTEDTSSSKNSTFHTPPVSAARSWLAEKESYGIEEDQEPFTDPLGIKGSPIQLADSKISQSIPDLPTLSTEIPPTTPTHQLSTSSATSPDSQISKKLTRRASSSVLPDNASAESVDSDGSGSTPYYLPPTLVKAVDQFVQSLKEPKFAAPLEPSAVASLYQEFYSYFANKADLYLQTGGHLPPKKREIQMETYEEIAEKRRERSLRPVKLREYMEAAEARACISVFERIYRPNVGDDEDRAKDIQSRVEAMKQLPRKLKFLDFDVTGSVLERLSDQDRETSLFAKLTPAGELFALMDEDDSVTPQKKLEHFISGHNLVVQTLSELFPNSQGKGSKASADMILPALIYTLMTYETPNLWLNLAYISRFRNASLLAGEPSYILTNFQAAIGFLESATLESLGISDNSEDLAGIDVTVLKKGVPDNRQPILEMPLLLAPPAIQAATQSLMGFGKSHKGLSHRVSLPSLNSGQNLGSRRSSMLAPTGIVTSADQAFKNIGMTFGNSYRFFLSKTNNPEKLSAAISEGDESFLSPSSASSKLKKSLSTTSVDSTGTCSAIPATPPVASKPTFDNPKSDSSHNEPPSTITTTTPVTSTAQPESNHHLLGRFANISMIKSFAGSSSAAPLSRSTSPPSSITSTQLPLKKPLDKICQKEWENLQMSEVKALHEDYKRLVEYLQSIRAFEK